MNNELFNSVHANATDITFNPEWKNGTGYLDGATTVDLSVGEVRSFTDDNNRKGILIGSAVGTTAVFERYTNGDSGVLVNNTNRFMSKALGAAVIREPQLRLLLELGRMESLEAGYIQARGILLDLGLGNIGKYDFEIKSYFEGARNASWSQHMTIGQMEQLKAAVEAE